MPIPETPHKIKVIFADEDNIKNKMKINERKTYSCARTFVTSSPFPVATC